MKVAEIFYSIQGEGLDMGVPALFIRLAGCNLRCVWCDTVGAQDEHNGTTMSVDAILAELRTFPCAFVVLTGGEPLLQEIKPLVQALVARDYTIAVETNGTVFNADLLNYVTTWAVSPKLPGSGMSYDDTIIKKYAVQPNAFFKFVIADDDDFAAVLALHGSHCFATIVFQSEGGTGAEGYRRLAERVQKERGKFGKAHVRVLPQLHKLMDVM